VITDVSAQTARHQLQGLVSALLGRGVPLTCCISLQHDAVLESRLRETLGVLQRIPGALDLAVFVPDLQLLSPHFQARTVYEARLKLLSLLGPSGGSLSLNTVLSDESEPALRPTGVRSAGFRNVLVRPQNSGPVQSEAWPNGVARFFGGQLIDPGVNLQPPAKTEAGENRLIYYVSAKRLDRFSEEQVLTWANKFATSLLDQEAAGRLALMTVPDIQLRDDFEITRSITVVLDLPESPGKAIQESASAFQMQIAEAGIASISKLGGDTFWVETTKAGSSIIPLTNECQSDKPGGIVTKTKLGQGNAIQLLGPGSQDFGLDGCAILRLPLTPLPQPVTASQFSRVLAGTNDIVLQVVPEQIATPVARRTLLASLQALRLDGITSFTNLSDLAQRLVPRGFIEDRHRRALQVRANEGLAAPAKLDEKARNALLDDAKHAWGYFQKMTNGVTGLCPATLDSRPGGESHLAVTMWDVGSNLNAFVAAAQIGLIDEKELRQRVNQVLPNITGRRSQDRLLPQGWIRTDRFHWGNKEFDGCDAGRLLAALDHLRRSYGMQERLTKHVAAWDFDKVILDRKIHSVTEGELVSTYSSHCAHYAALAFRRWGYDVASPYETFAGRSSADGEIALLEAVAGIGPLGAEPLLLEAMELGMSPESRYLADILDTAQQEEFQSSGRRICASETPIDQSPWFIYQGLQLGIGEREWRLDTVGNKPQFMTAEAANAFLALSTKAAFLWSAYKSNSFTNELLAYAREKARNQVGFASSVNLSTERPTKGYTDLNTNAVILQAIAHALRKV